ncbi:DNA translocase FtsK 4TM domain-containing protein [Sandaracinobacteroides sayramensis]|uniref:FtsK/SpoIIIE family DNA translocase n=1 Tax=Sandaracinobacteroides sayramensis TaxID=2913411 RepID=UPI002106695D|nr:DNA translocase FtsK 4TM domain-containing protein [Sandaracinobacteroides sayramensis]
MEGALGRRPKKAQARNDWDAPEGPSFGERLSGFARGAARVLFGLAVVALGVALAAALLSYNPSDPSFNSATSATPTNIAGAPGAYVADLLLQGFGLASALLVPIFLVTGLRLVVGRPLHRFRRSVGLTLLALLLSAAALGLAWPAPIGTLDAGAGGVLGLALARLLSAIPFPAGFDPAIAAIRAAILFGLIGLALFLWGLGPSRQELGAVGRLFAFRRGFEEAEAEAPWEQPAAQPEPRARKAAVRENPLPPPEAEPEAPQRRIAGPAPRQPPKREAPDRQPALQLGDRADLPPLSLLKPPPRQQAAGLDEAALEQNARLLEGVLEDFGVKGRIVGLAQGPVVTLYELEPAPGIKASRVIGLADDIARSMSAVSARVAVIPGRNVIGIELPNLKREMVSLSELIAADSFQGSSGTLPMILGKDISGAPVVADLAPMPHLLIAGTTGSGKSVGLNAMILSLLYRLRPDQCRMIMIDPKMLELSVYDDIPHLLAPVVIEPQKAIRALKWAVEQMEERYRNMAHINVRSLSGYNDKVREALKSGKPFIKRVQTGWDEEGKPEFEDISLPLEPLPLIVVVVDELADLMMTAGKEVEFLIQRLAQKARAAGIHLIMATQRPSVDVITGVIKANLPTRISFQVTSKIDSRTILGEMGAEQLLGKGDMLYMPGGKQCVRVHGPFVSDEEVEAVAEHWKAQGAPDYLSSVTEEPEGGDMLGAIPGSAKGGAGGAAGNADDPLQQAIQVVATSRKATISYLQRQLRIGYNSAARLIDQMEEMGLVSSPDHVGRREVLMDEAGNRLP